MPTEPSSLEQAMIPQQALMNDALSPHTPSLLPANAHETVTGTDIVYLACLQPQPVEWLRDCLQPGSQTQGSIEVVAPKTENLVPGGGFFRIRRMSALRSTRQDAQMNYLSTLSIFVKQTTYLATLPNPKNLRQTNGSTTASCGISVPKEQIEEILKEQ
jgi:hypothetical protein